MKLFSFANGLLLVLASSSAAFANPFATGSGSGSGSGYSPRSNPQPSFQEGSQLFSFQEIPLVEFQEIEPIQFFDGSPH